MHDTMAPIVRASSRAGMHTTMRELPFACDEGIERPLAVVILAMLGTTGKRCRVRP